MTRAKDTRALEATLRIREAELARKDEEHRKELDAKNRLIREQTSQQLILLRQTFPELPDLLHELVKAHDASSPLRSAGGHTGRPSGKSIPDPTGNSAITHRSDDTRITTINRRLSGLVEWIQGSMGDRGPLDEQAPVCHNPYCDDQGWAQPYDATTCRTCKAPFGTHRPGRRQARDVRCGTRGCPGRNRVNQCIHSWEKMGIGPEPVPTDQNADHG